MAYNDTKTPGDPILADDWNALVRSIRGLSQDSASRPESPAEPYSADIALVLNNSGVALSRFSAVGLGAPIITPTANLPEFKRQPTFKVVKAVAGTHEGKTGILLEPLATGAIGACLVSGVCQCQITGADVGFAEITNGQTYLTAGATGKVQVLYAEPGSGLRWATVRLLGTSSVGAGTTITLRYSDGTGTLSGISTVEADIATLILSNPSGGVGRLAAKRTSKTVVTAVDLST